MSRDKQISEMAKDIACKTAWDEDEIPTINCLETAKRLYNAGYHKASEVAREIFEEISKASVNWGCYCITTSKAGFLTEDVNRTLTELKYKYTEERNEITIEIPDNTVLATVSLAIQNKDNPRNVMMGVIPILTEDLKDGNTVDLRPKDEESEDK